MKSKYWGLALAWVIAALSVTQSFAGAPTCGRGYCRDQNGGCSPCHFGRISDAPAEIPIDSEWKRAVHEFAKKNVVHPSWGFAHSLRNYRVTQELAARQGIAIDTDVLFAAAFLHDLGGLDGFAKPGVDHAVRSVELAEPLLKGFGFPMAKFNAVKEMILGHTYYGSAPAGAAALAFRDADILDFLGAIGIARIFAVTLEPGRAQPTLKPFLDLLKSFRETLPAKLSLNASKAACTQRIQEMDAFFAGIQNASFGDSGGI